MDIKFNNSDLCRIWAQQSLPYAHGLNLVLKGRSIYDYAEVTELVRLVGKNKNIVLINSKEYGNSRTMLKYVKKAVPLFTHIFIVEDFSDHKKNMKLYHERINESLTKALRSIKYFDQHFNESERLAMELLDYINIFGIEPDRKTRNLEHKMNNEGLLDEQKREEIRKKKEEWLHKKNEREWERIRKWSPFKPANIPINAEVFHCTQAQMRQILESSYDIKTHSFAHS